LILPGADAVARVAESIGGAGHRTTREAADHVVADPWGTTLRIRS